MLNIAEASSTPGFSMTNKNMILEILLRLLIHMRFWVGQRFSAAMTNVYLNNMSFRPAPKRQRRRGGGSCRPRFCEIPV